MRISDWISDVCASDLHVRGAIRRDGGAIRGAGRAAPAALVGLARDPGTYRVLAGPRPSPSRTHPVRPFGRRLDERLSISMSWRQLSITLVDAFADRPSTGNPAAVMPHDEWLGEALMLAIDRKSTRLNSSH